MLRSRFEAVAVGSVCRFARGWRMGLYFIRRWTIRQPLALRTYDDEFISALLATMWNCREGFFFLRKGAGLLWLLCFSQYFSHGFYTSRTPSISCYEFVSVLNWLPNINPFFCLCVLCASVSVPCVFLPRNCRRRRAWCYGLSRWLWLVMAGYEVLFGIRNRIRTLCVFLDGDIARNLLKTSFIKTSLVRALTMMTSFSL